MTRTVVVHSFRRGTGKSHIIANVATLLALRGLEVGILDIGFPSPSLHLLFGLSESDIGYTLNDYLRGRCVIEETACHINGGQHVAFGKKVLKNLDGRILLFAASPDTKSFIDLISHGYELQHLSSALESLKNRLHLDVLLIETYSGLNESAFLCLALCDLLLVVLRLDQQDFQGTGVVVDVASHLNVPRTMLTVNQVLSMYDRTSVKERLEETYRCQVASVIPFSEDVMALAGRDVFVLEYPDHALTETFNEVANALTSI